ncbi:hypothetical protein [Halospeciosus flavus]|uniref:Uncharacterized protein n=1 Tax=Halospeciosus flavus TaxID=3032283 RepID=A0ABD5Z2V5_9EURY|nr:hypothetical protein [Halospeciosus flavus]
MAYETLLKSWGDPGVEWKDGWAFAKDEPLPAEWANFLFDNLIKDVQHLIDHTNTLDPETDGTVVNADKVDGLHADQLGGFKFTQVETPDNLTESVSWHKTSSGLLYISDGEKFEAQPEIGYQEYDDFTVSDVAVTFDPVPRTELTDTGSIKLIDEVVVADFTDGVKPNDRAWEWTTAPSLSGTEGHVESVGNTASAVLTREAPVAQNIEARLRIDGDTANINDAAHLRLDGPNGTRWFQITFNDGGGNVTLHDNSELFASWSPGSNYDFEFDVDYDAGTFTLFINGVEELTDYPMENAVSGTSEITFITDTSSSGYTRAIYLDSIVEGAREYGETILTPVEPDERITDWDILRYTETEDGETVTVDVLDEVGNVLVSDIENHGDISTAVPAGTNLQIRVRIARSNVANNPTFDGFYRRWVMRPGDTGLSKKEEEEWKAMDTRARYRHTRLARRQS